MFVRQNLRSLVAVALLIFSAASTGADDCPCGWYASGGHCYKLFPVASKWAQAQQTCKAENANLVSIHNANEAEIVECLRNGEWVSTHHMMGKLMETYDVAQTAGAAKTRGD